jgi:S1-C subfamily serine protease
MNPGGRDGRAPATYEASPMSRIRLAALALAALALTVPPARAQSDGGERVYQSVLKSTVWIHSSRGGGKVATGSGALIDRRRHLVLTNYHVVDDKDDATVFFPVFRGDRLVAERDYYKEHFRELALRGHVVARDKRHDLALVQLDTVPEGAQALPIAPNGVHPGQTVHSIGNPGASGALWVYTPGKVRQVYHRQWKANDEGRTLTFEAQIVETDSPTNPGDSGGPLVNDRAELVGVTQGGDFNARNVSTFIDLSEIKAFLGVPESRSVKPPESKAAARAGALTVKDEGKFFSAEAVQKANAEIAELHHRFGRDLLVETYATVPAADVEKVKAMKAPERLAYFKQWARERERAQQVHGVALLVTKEPATLYVLVPEGSKKLFGEDFERQLRDTVLAKFREKKYDDGLLAAVQAVRERLEAEKPRP